MELENQYQDLSSTETISSQEQSSLAQTQSDYISTPSGKQEQWTNGSTTEDHISSLYSTSSSVSLLTWDANGNLVTIRNASMDMCSLLSSSIRCFRCISCLSIWSGILDGMPLGISGTFNHVCIPSRAQHSYAPIPVGVAGMLETYSQLCTVHLLFL